LEEEETEEVAFPVEEYQPQDLSEEEAIRRAIEESELLELGQWTGLEEQLAASTSTSGASVSTSRAALPPPPPASPAPEPQPWGYAVWESQLRASLSGELGASGTAEP
jgi:hypothetical protein